MDKKRRIIIVGIVISLFVLVSSVTISALVLLNDKGVSRTVMIYMVGSNLESQAGLATVDLNSMKKNNDNTRVLVIAGGTKSWEIGRAHV